MSSVLSIQQCFTTNLELRNAVQQYVQPGVSSNPNSDIAIKYGWPINEWCVTNVTDFSYLFTPVDESDVSTLFNYNISQWDMSNAINISSMFEGAYAFNYDISQWDVSKVIAMDKLMYRAFSFNKRLCAWGDKLLLNSQLLSVQDSFKDSGCIEQNDPSFNTNDIPGPFCDVCGTSELVPSLSPAGLVPNTINSTTTNGLCFQSRVELELAVLEYLQDNSPLSDVASRYGWPINTWCVTNITDFSYLFSPANNLDKATFNEDISKWDMSSATTVEGMFDSNEFFNQDISDWKFSPALQNSYRMFNGAKSFNHSLCQWGQQQIGVAIYNPFKQSTVNVTKMFRDTSCSTILDPVYNSTPYPGPFCSDCSIVVVISTTPTPTPTQVPVTPSIQDLSSQPPTQVPVVSYPSVSTPSIPIIQPSLPPGTTASPMTTIITTPPLNGSTSIPTIISPQTTPPVQAPTSSAIMIIICPFNLFLSMVVLPIVLGITKL